MPFTVAANGNFIVLTESLVNVEKGINEIQRLLINLEILKIETKLLHDPYLSTSGNWFLASGYS